jgi:UDP-N-acetylglucosamine 2-epimerase (non-hydrolysing)
MAEASNPYGDGKASLRICENIKYYYGIRKDKPESFNV